jgi:hypothetical protein
MVEFGPEARNVRLAALMERAEEVFERSRRLVEEARKTRSEAEAKLLSCVADDRLKDADKVS